MTLDWTLDLAARAATVRDFRTELGDLWRHYVDYEAPRVTAACHLPADTVPIRWYVRGQDKWGAIVLSEVAPQQFLTGDADQAAEDDILAHYEMPTNVGTGQPINWLRVPVADYSRVRGAAGGALVQRHLGWRPAAFQATVNLRKLALLAGVYYPERQAA
ncbi:hypothetical protein [Actinomadura yumaensis]|uniref:Uncharacterized protein n=1 Tax=Actinomadura yumaensis TaxID=111807 RepID=A0ABW2CT24_9ACTN